MRIVVIIFSLIAMFAAPVFAQTSANVGWGTSGHNDYNDSSYPYNAIPISQQMDLHRSAGMTMYRAGCTNATCPVLASQSGITFLRILEVKPSANISGSANYTKGFNYARAEAIKFPSITYYEAANELDLWVGWANGQYNQSRYVRAREFVKGLIAGVRAANPSAKVVVDDSGGCNIAFLNKWWSDGVRWDITGVHWYSEMGDITRSPICGNANIIQQHAEFGTPIWITEWNSRTPNDSSYATSFINQIKSIAQTYNIQAAFVYELFDEPGISGSEGTYGIINSDGTPKTVYETIKSILSTPQPCQTCPVCP